MLPNRISEGNAAVFFWCDGWCCGAYFHQTLMITVCSVYDSEYKYLCEHLHFFQKLLANVFPAQHYGSEASWCKTKISAHCLCVESYKSWENTLFMCWISFQSWEKQHVNGDGSKVWILANKCVTLQCNECWEKQHVHGDGSEVWTLANKCVTLQCNKWVMDMV